MNDCSHVRTSERLKANRCERNLRGLNIKSSIRVWQVPGKFHIEEGFIAQKTCDGKEYLTSRTPFGMMVLVLGLGE